MLNTPTDFGYTEGYDPHQHNGERPKLFGLESHHGAHMVHHGMHDFQHMVNAPPHHTGAEFDHEPLMMNMHNPSSHFYPHMGGQLLHVSSDYGNGSLDGTTPRSSTGPVKRSREDLNMKEKKRMFKLNDRISQLKDVLDEAGVQSKKNKQSILDNTFHYISMLRSNLLIAKQKAERAEKQVEQLRTHVQKNGNGTSTTGDTPAELAYKRCFQQSSTPRIVVDFDLDPVTYNMAFLNHTGLSEDMLMMKDALRAALCVDDNKLSYIVNDVAEGNKPVSVVVQARTATGISTLTLIASVMTDEVGKPNSIEFTLIPFEIASDLPQQSFHAIVAKQDGQEASPSSVELIL